MDTDTDDPVDGADETPTTRSSTAPDRAFVVEEDMRVVELLVLTAQTFERAVAVLDDLELDYVVSDRTDDTDGSAVVRFPLPSHLVEHVQSRFESMGIDEDLYTVVVDPEVVVSNRFESDELYREIGGRGYWGVSRSELKGRAGDLIPDLSIYVLLTAISSVVATAGVLLDSIGVLIGSMVIAPLIGPMIATAVGTIIDDDMLFFEGLKHQVIGVAGGLCSTVAFAALVRFSSITPAVDRSTLLAISGYTAPTFLLVAVALGAGFAGALSLSTGDTIDLVGVMIAAAVMPPIGVVGVAVAWTYPVIALGSLSVVLLNLHAMLLAAIVSLWYLGFHPESLEKLRPARRTMLVRVVTLVAIILGLTVVLTQVPTAGAILSV
ncbi:TIGR00341 family protein [Halorientalis pallida]|uniref:TIGR00341 family protein n=1 Tax=Halorientalis pallida TaxID=2479928 RepID=UPI003C6EBE1D